MISVDPEAGTLTARMDDGRSHRFTPEQTAADRLAHGYAVTVHRFQGATVERAHRFEDGGGRELAYVAMSRARDRSTVYVVADDLDQAVEDLRRDWSVERRPRWAIDTGTPTTDPVEVEADHRSPQPLRTALRQARLRAEREALVAVLPPDPASAINQAVADLTRLRTARLELETGRGQYAHTPPGQAARVLQEASRRRREADDFAARPDTGWRMRRWWRKEAAVRQAAEADAGQTWTRVASPTITRIDDAIDRVQHQLDQLQGEQTTRVHWLQQHPDALHRLTAINAQLTAVELDRRFDALHSLGRAIAEPQGLGLDRGLEL